jgi:DNA-binding transcriptional MerR regulator
LPLKLNKKGYKRIGEVSRLTGIAPSTLRFWEKEFTQLKPAKRGGQRLYSPQDIELIMRIKDLVHHKGFTLEGAKRELSSKATPRTQVSGIIEGLEEIKKDLQKILNNLEKK